MASASISFSQLSPPGKVVHTGVIVSGAALSTSTGLATVCPSTVLAITNFPNKATLLNFWGRIQTGGASQTFQMGTSNAPSAVMSVTTLSETLSISTQATSPGGYGVFNQGWFSPWGGTQGGTGAASDLMPVQFSISDDVSPQSVMVRGNVGAGCSASAFFTFIFMYTMDGLKGHTVTR